MHVKTSVVGSGRTWLGFAFGALSVVAGPMIVASLLNRIDPPGTRDGDRQIKAAADVMAITEVLQLFRDEHGHYPTTAEGLAVLVPKQLDRIPTDPWGNDYSYSLVNDTPYVASYGADGKPGGVDAAADITPETVDVIRSAHGKSIPSPIGLALVLIGALVVPAIAFRTPGRPFWAVGAVSGAAFSAGFLLLFVGAAAAVNAWIPLLVAGLFVCMSIGVLLRVPYADPVAMTGAVVLGVALWVFSNMISR